MSMIDCEKFNGRNILVTGGAGFIGSHVCDILLSFGSQVSCLDNFDPYYAGKNVNIAEAKHDPNFRMITSDIMSGLHSEVVSNDYDFIFHYAGQPGVHYSVEFPEKAFTINLIGSINVLELARKRNIGRIVFASSSSVYGDTRSFPVSETANLKPLSPYGVSKVLLEKACIYYAETYGINLVILRYHTLYGPRQRPDMAIRKWVTTLLTREAPVIYGDGEQSRDFTFIVDAVAGTLLAATKAPRSSIFNIGSGSRITVNEILNKIIQILSIRDIKPLYQSERYGDVGHTYADIKKAREELGYFPKTSLEDGLKEEIDWLKSNLKACK
jgi:nucleoside-diphosphate-sugar epimerase